MQKEIERIHTIIEKMPDGVCVSVDDQIVFGNSTLADMLGYEEAEIQGMGLIDLVHPSEREQFTGQQKDLLSGGREYPSEYHLVRRNGAAVPVEIFFRPINYADQEAYLCVFRNLTAWKSVEEAMTESEERFRTFVDHAPEAIVIYDANTGSFLDSNQNALELFGMDRAALFELGPIEVSPPHQPDGRASRELYEEKIQRALDGETPVFEWNYRHSSGQEIPCEVRMVRLPSAGRTLIRGSITDISDRKQAERDLRESEERYALAAQGANDGLWDWDLRSDEMYFSPRWKAMLGHKDSEIGNESEEWFERIHPDDIDSVKRTIDAHIQEQTPHFESEHRILHKDGSHRWMLTRGLAVRDREGKAYRMAGSQTDITERKLAEAQLIHDAFHDGLTGLPNRSLFLDRLQHAIDRARRRKTHKFAMLFLDVDRFKNVNDSFGHIIGDELLIELARRLENCLRPGDTVARFGGDEFAILVEEIQSITDATRVANRVQQKLNQAFKLIGQEVFITASVGITTSDNNYDRPEFLLRDADTAMYRAKALGKDQYAIFDSHMHTTAMSLLQIESDMRRAVERDEFRLHYQPIISLETGEITGEEALIRWEHPQQGLLGPTEFIPVAEETGLIFPVGEWVLSTACTQAITWQDMDLSYQRMVINLSVRQFKQKDLVQSILRVLSETGLSPQYLEIELTETVLMENVEEAIATMVELQDIGVRISIDDFGTGYSSLGYLKRLPIDTLKIDRAFLSDIVTDATSHAIVSAVVSLGHDLGLNVIAEGVETEEQLNILREMKCDEMQGFLFSKALPGEEATDLLRERKTFGV